MTQGQSLGWVQVVVLLRVWWAPSCDSSQMIAPEGLCCPKQPHSHVCCMMLATGDMVTETEVGVMSLLEGTTSQGVWVASAS